ncbi:MAG: sulfatase [Phycisphaerae bacterium]|nr:sulfatase [Phycisphaerae bacterium]
MDPVLENSLLVTRRQFFDRCCDSISRGVGMAALGSLVGVPSLDALAGQPDPGLGLLGSPHFAPKAKRVIYLFMSGAPSQMDMYDYKPKMQEYFDKELPESIRQGQRLTTMTSGQDRFPIAPSKYKFKQYGQSGAWISELLPHTASMVDDLCIIKSMHTEAINHDPAITFMMTGGQQPGRPSMGAWLSYGLGSVNNELPAFVVLHSTWTGRPEAQALYNRLWGTGFLPSEYQGVALRSKGDPVLYLSNPPGIDDQSRRRMLDRLSMINREHYEAIGDPETNARIAQYEMAYRMQASVPELTDLSDEPDHVFDMYGPDARKPGTFAANCLLARRLAERDVRFVQVFIRGWDHHFNLPTDLPNSCRDIDQPSMALVKDLKQRGMLDDTLVIWGGEFGRTVYCQGALTKENYGRDHHPRCFSIWMAGAGIKPGIVHGETDDFSYNITRDPVHVHDLNATVLAQMGIDHERLTYRFQGRDFRLTDVHGRIVKDILA